MFQPSLSWRCNRKFGISSSTPVFSWREFCFGGQSCSLPRTSAGPFRFIFSLRPYPATPYRHFWHFALMWVTVTFAYLIPALVLMAMMLSSERKRDADALVA